MKLFSTFLSILFMASCSSSEHTSKPTSKDVRPILDTEKVSELDSQENVTIKTVILADLLLYTESCEKRKQKKSKLSEIVFLKIQELNPSPQMLNALNKGFLSQQNIKTANKGFAVSELGFLSGYKDADNNRGHLINISTVHFKNDSTVAVGFSESRASLAGVDKSYILNQKESEWIISKCIVNSYS